MATAKKPAAKRKTKAKSNAKAANDQPLAIRRANEVPSLPANHRF